MRISVALCTYNGEKYLPQQLDSLLRQERPPDRIVIRDDVSTDGTWALLEAFATQARQRGIDVDLRRNAGNLGYVRNFEQALKATDGDLVFLCDQDDVWRVEKIRRMAGEFERRPRLGLLHTDARLVDGVGGDLGLGLFEALEITPAEIAAEHAGDAFDVLLRRNTVTGATTALRRTLLDALLPVPDGWVHDEWLAMGTCVQAQVDCLAWPSIDYRQHGGNQIGARRRTRRERLLGSGMPKREFMALVAGRLERALDRLHDANLAPPVGKEEQVRERIAHARFRAELPSSAFARWPMVAREARAGRYRRYSSGLRSIVSDLLDLS